MRRSVRSRRWLKAFQFSNRASRKMKQENLLTSLSVEQALSILAGAQQTVLAAERAARLSGDRMKEITTLSIALDAERLAEEELVRAKNLATDN
jgi:hypothetical protein